jgi:DNA-binding NtrC family response regulator/tetratricopeptide (TPR) repeat protein
MALDALIGDSPGVVAIRAQVEQLLRMRSAVRRLPAVLVLGETGTGKGLLARTIHDAGPRSAGPFVAINCAAIPETLLEAELFGFERGAFTDARHAKAGLFQTAHRGTLFLDEIGLLPQSVQAKLLTVLEDRVVRRLGSTRTEEVDVWIITASSQDLKSEVSRRRFREELYHRLAVVTLRLPPLRTRGADILTLAEHFLARTCADYGLAPKTLAADARAALLAYRWPGNVREVANVMERVALLVDGPVVTAARLELAIPRGQRPSYLQDSETTRGNEPMGVSLGERVEDVERRHILEAMHETRWNISRAASRLGVTRNILRYRLLKYGLLSPDGKADPKPPAEAASTTVAAAPAPKPITLQWERRHVAVLRADLVTTAPAGAASSSGAWLETLVEKIESFGGRVEEVSPEGLMAVYGLDPIEDAARRAAHAALAIQKVAVRGGYGLPESPSVRVGLHVGEFLVAWVGDALRIDHSAKREAWQQLEALMGGAGSGTVLVSAPTLPFLERRFVLVPFAGSRGTSESVYRLEGLERTGLGLGEQLTPFVARDRELEQLAQALEQARSGHGQVIGIVGEPGVGKSRLLWELIDARRVQDSLALVSSAASYGKATPYLAVIDLLKTYFHVEPRDDADRVRERITEWLAREHGLAPARSALLALLDVLGDDARWRELDPQQKRTRTLEAVKLLLLEESRRQPLILVFEDLQWADAETQAVLDTLVESLSSHHVLLLVSYRPEHRHAWGSKSCYAQLRLDPLSPENAHALLDRLIGSDASVATLRAELIARTGGNPFFLEESVRTLVETRVLVGDRGTYRLGQPFGEIQVPATVKAVLAARVDRLAREDRALLQAAAVVGRDVPLALLLAAADLPEEALQAGLTRLRASEFLHETRLVPEPGYAFKHALTHEVAYAGLLKDQRRVLHARIMAAIERLHAHRLGEQVDRLAYHALRGEVWDKAAVYFRQAGVKAAERSAYREAVACFEHALGALSHLPEIRETTEQGIDLRMDLRNSLNPLGDIRRSSEYMCEAEILAERIGDRRRLGWISAYAAFHYWQSSDLDHAVESGRRALATAQTCGDFALRVVANLHLGQAHLGLGELHRAREYLQSNVESLAGDRSYERFGERLLPSVENRLWLVHVLVEGGEFAEAIARGEEAARIGEAVDHPLSLIGAYRGLGYLYLRKGDLERAIQFLERCSDVSRLWSIPAWTSAIASYMGYAYVLSGRLADGLSLLEHNTTEQGAPRQNFTGYAALLAYLSEAYALANREEDALRTINQALDFARHRKRRHQEAWALRALGEIAVHRDPPNAAMAEASYQEALALADELGLRPIVADCHLGLGKLFGRAGKRQEACEHLTTAATMYRAMDMTFWLEKTEAVMESGRLRT